MMVCDAERAERKEQGDEGNVREACSAGKAKVMVTPGLFN